MAANNESVQRMRQMMASYYGTTAEPGAAPRKVDVMNIDSGDFDVKQYTTELLTGKSVDDLVSKGKEVHSEIKRLDSEMQSLVYENYNKFISASDIIRQMKLKVDSLDHEMQVLSQNMDAVVAHADDLSDKLSDNRQKMQNLARTTEFFEKIQFLIQLPGKMKSHLDIGGDSAYSEVVRLQVKYGRALERLAKMPEIQGVAAECRAIVERVKSELEVRVARPGYPRDRVNADMKLLMLLNDDILKMRGTYIDQQMKALNALLQRCVASRASIPAGTHPVSAITNAVVPAVKDFARNFSTLFLHGEQVDVTAGANLLDSAGSEIMQAFFAVIKTEFALPCDGGAPQLFHAMETLRLGVQQVQGELPGVSFKKRVAEVATGAALSFVHNAFGRAREGLQSELLALAARAKAPLAAGSTAADHIAGLAAGAEKAADKVRAALADALTAVRPLAEPSKFDDRDGLVATEVHVKAQQVLLGIFDAVMSHVHELERTRDPRVVSGAFVLALARLCVVLAGEIVAPFVASVRRSFVVQDGQILADESVFEGDLSKATAALIQLYVDMHGQNLANGLVATFDGVNWLTAAAPAEGSPSKFEKLFNALALLKGEAEGLCPPPASKAAGSHRRTPSAAGSGAAPAHGRVAAGFDLKRMEEASAGHVRLVFTAPSILGETLAYVLRALLESVRAATFTPGGAAAMQAEIDRMRIELLAMLEQDRFTASLLEEVARSLRDRSLSSA